MGVKGWKKWLWLTGNFLNFRYISFLRIDIWVFRNSVLVQRGGNTIDQFMVVAGTVTIFVQFKERTLVNLSDDKFGINITAFELNKEICLNVLISQREIWSRLHSPSCRSPGFKKFKSQIGQPRGCQFHSKLEFHQQLSRRSSRKVKLESFRLTNYSRSIALSATNNLYFGVCTRLTS